MLRRDRLEFIPLPDVECTVYRFKSAVRHHESVPEAIEIPKILCREERIASAGGDVPSS